jgi:hypothetical protein
MYLAMREQQEEDKVKTKPAVKSLGILGSISSIGTMLGMLGMIKDVWASIPPELIAETKTFATVTVVAVVQQLLALIGRWRATKPIKGILK